MADDVKRDDEGSPADSEGAVLSGEVKEVQPKESGRGASLSSRSGNGGNGPAETRKAVELGIADEVTGNAIPDDFGRDSNVDYPVDPLAADENVRWDKARESEENGKGSHK